MPIHALIFYGKNTSIQYFIWPSFVFVCRVCPKVVSPWDTFLVVQLMFDSMTGVTDIFSIAQFCQLVNSIHRIFPLDCATKVAITGDYYVDDYSFIYLLINILLLFLNWDYVRSVIVDIWLVKKSLHK